MSNAETVEVGDIVEGTKSGDCMCGKRLEVVAMSPGRDITVYPVDGSNIRIPNLSTMTCSSLEAIRTLKIIKKASKSKNTEDMKLTEQFALALTPEPYKSFRKAGITDGDNILTDEGMRVFLSYLLKQNADNFKKDVVDPMLADKKDQ